MRFVDKSKVTIPKWFQHTNPNFVKKTKNTLPQNGKKVDSNYYNKAFLTLTILYSDCCVSGKIYVAKCAFCESLDNGTSRYEVEHYRPKKEVAEDTSHPGYYWLAYEWSNLLLSCQTCNRGEGGKHNKFPIANSGRRIYKERLYRSNITKSSFDLQRLQKIEQPLLLHPEMDDPTLHLIFKNDGKLHGITRRGRATIDICKLNRRLLWKNRQKLIEGFRNKIKNLLIAYSKKLITKKYTNESLKKIFIKIKNSQLGHKEFTLLGKNMFDNFDYFFVSQLSNIKQREVLDKLFRKYQNGAL
ncbi:MAG: hypothetical protein KDK90_26745 [Leptospiraceae bacterium]|nr:hypothetical protein [Leptospiraceae bacterium]